MDSPQCELPHMSHWIFITTLSSYCFSILLVWKPRLTLPKTSCEFSREANQALQSVRMTRGSMEGYTSVRTSRSLPVRKLRFCSPFVQNPSWVEKHPQDKSVCLPNSVCFCFLCGCLSFLVSPCFLTTFPDISYLPDPQTGQGLSHRVILQGGNN